MALSRKIYWAVVAATLAVFGVMVLLIAPKISAGAGGRLLFDEQLSYSHAYAVEFVGALTNEARALYLVELRLLDTLFPILLAICLTVGVARLTHGWKLRNRAIAVIPPLLGAFFDLMENAAVAAMRPDRLRRDYRACVRGNDRAPVGWRPEMTEPFTVAIDGPAASGKGTISRAVAAEFGFAHLDTGLLYRAVGAKGGDPAEAARSLTAEDLKRGDLRTAEAGQAASRVAADPEVREALVDFQRAFARRAGGAVLDGRDIGTVICPEAEVKLYVTASDEVRARRRHAELAAEGSALDFQTVLAQIRERDARDADRDAAPMKPAADAHLLDTTELAIAAAVAEAVAYIKKKRDAGAGRLG
jgi:cytidylate kinase